MKFVLMLLFFNSFMAYAISIADSISGKVESVPGCSKKVMVWLSLDKEDYKQRQLLLHTEVPVGGTYQFFAKPGDYQVRASDEAGCEFFKRVSLKSEDLKILVRMVKK